MIDEEDGNIAGHGRARAAHLLGLDEVPCIVLVASWLLDLTANALAKDPELAGFAGRVSDSGEGRWAVKAAIDEAVPAHVLAAALYDRFASRGEAEFANKLLSAMRCEFGGHIEKPAG